MSIYEDLDHLYWAERLDRVDHATARDSFMYIMTERPEYNEFIGLGRMACVALCERLVNGLNGEQPQFNVWELPAANDFSAQLNLPLPLLHTEDLELSASGLTAYNMHSTRGLLVGWAERYGPVIVQGMSN